MQTEPRPSGKKRGPAPTGKGTPVMVRLQPELLSALDAMIADDGRGATRPEWIRYALTDWLTGLGYLKHREDPEGANGRS